MTATERRYHAIAIALHWAIAVLIVTLVIVGTWMHGAQEALVANAKDAPPAALVQAVYQMHKSFGLLALALTAARLVWRLLNPPPPLPAHLAPWERAAAHAVHWAFYGLMFAMPLSGWALASASTTPYPTRLFFVEWLPWPHIGALAHLAPDAKADAEATIGEAHKLLAYGALGLLAVHLGAVARHVFVARDTVLARIAPGLAGDIAGPEPARGPGLIWGVGVGLPVGVLALGVAAGLILAGKPAEAALGQGGGGWTVDAAASRIAFTTRYLDKPLTGAFERWRAEIDFDPANPGAARIVAVIDTGSAATGVSANDATLRGAEWFDVAKHPTARFEAGGARALPEGGYRALGTLTIKETALPIALDFTLAIAGDVATAKGKASLDRVSFDLGKVSDPSGDWVAREVAIAVDIRATRGAAAPPG